MDDTKLGQVVVYTKIISFSCQYCTTKLSLPWDHKTKDVCDNTIYGRVSNCKLSPILGSRNNWVIMNFLDDEIYNVEFEHINITILDGNVTNTLSVICK